MLGYTFFSYERSGPSGGVLFGVKDSHHLILADNKNISDMDVAVTQEKNALT